MQHALVAIALTGTAVAICALGVAQAAPSDVVPVHGSGGACKPSPPHLLATGRTPLAPLRLDLAGIAHRSRSVAEVEQFATRVRTIEGRWHSVVEIRKVRETLRGGSIEGGQVGLVAKAHVSFPRTKTLAAGTSQSFTIRGRTDALSGGLLGGTRGNDRFPVEPVGVGARWSVVTCDVVEEMPAKQVRTYTLRSVAGGLIVMTFRDVVSLDPTRRDAGSQKLGNATVRFRLDSLGGTAVGTSRIPIADGLAGSLKVVTRVQFAFHAISPNVPTTPIITRLVDTRTDTPGG
jgi:hypothetical protein